MTTFPVLRIENGDARGSLVELRGPVVLGRARECDVVLADESCSRTHARVSPGPDGALVEDLGSTNGTYVNGERVRSAELHDGDELLIGGTLLRLRMPSRAGSRTVVLSPPLGSDVLVVEPVDDADGERARPPQGLAEAFRRLARAAAGGGDRDALLAALVRGTRDLIPLERCAAVALSGGAMEPAGPTQGSPDLAPAGSSPWFRKAVRDGRALLLAEETRSGRRRALVLPVADEGRARALLFCDRKAPPFDRAEVESAQLLAAAAASWIEVLAEHAETRRRLVECEREMRGDRRVVGESEAHLESVRLVRRLAPEEGPVLFIGESGTGKEMLAHLLHDISPRARGPFLTLNCAAHSDDLVEAELFGDAEGIDGGALGRARGGTLLLDEIDALDLASQARLVQVVRKGTLEAGREQRRLDVRLLAASDRDLSSRASSGAFHEDFLALLARATIRIRPLRERTPDIPLLADHFLRTLARRMNRPARRFSGRAMKALLEYSWPGNVRELKNVVERAVILASGEEIDADLLPFADGARSADPDLSLAAAEKLAIERALRHFRGRKGKAAAALGISWPTLNKKIARYGIEVPGRS